MRPPWLQLKTGHPYKRFYLIGNEIGVKLHGRQRNAIRAICEKKIDNGRVLFTLTLLQRKPPKMRNGTSQFVSIIICSLKLVGYGDKS